MENTETNELDQDIAKILFETDRGIAEVLGIPHRADEQSLNVYWEGQVDLAGTIVSSDSTIFSPTTDAYDAMWVLDRISEFTDWTVGGGTAVFTINVDSCNNNGKQVSLGSVLTSEKKVGEIFLSMPVGARLMRHVYNTLYTAKKNGIYTAGTQTQVAEDAEQTAVAS